MSTPETNSGYPFDRRTVLKAMAAAAGGLVFGVSTTGDTVQAPPYLGDPTYRKLFPELFLPGSWQRPDDRPLLTDEIVAQLRDYYQVSRDNLGEAYQESIKTIPIGDRYFRASVVPGEEGTIVSGTEYANRIGFEPFLRQMGIRAVAAPGFGSVLLGNNAMRSHDLNLSPEERQLLTGGNIDPISKRIEAALRLAGSRALHLVGLSESNAKMAAFGATADADIRSVTCIEPPHLRGQNSLLVAYNFARSGGMLDEYKQISYGGIDLPFTDEGSLSDYVKSAVNDPDNRASAEFMMRGGMDEYLLEILRKYPQVGLGLLWGSRSRISPPDSNRVLANEFNPAQNHTIRCQEVPRGEHGITNAHALVAAATRDAIRRAA